MKIWPVLALGLLSAPVTLGQWATGPVSLPSGALLLTTLDSACPTGTTEATDLAGKTLVLTTVAAQNAGTTGGDDTLTPEGMLSAPTFTGDAIASVITHTHAVDVTDPGHSHTQTVNTATNGGLKGYAPDTSTNTGQASGYSTASATTGVTASAAAPGGAVASVTPTGTVSAPTFTGVAFDNRSAFVRVVACRVN